MALGRRDGGLELGERLGVVVRHEQDVGELGAPSVLVAWSTVGEARHQLAEMVLGEVEPPGQPRGLGRLLQQGGALVRIAGRHAERPIEELDRATRRVHGQRSPRRATGELAGPARRGGRPRRLGIGLVGGGQMTGHAFDQLAATDRLEVTRRRQVHRCPLGPRDRSVGKLANQLLYEGQRASVRGPQIVVMGEELSLEEGTDTPAQLGATQSGDCRERVGAEGAAEHRRVQQQRAFGDRQRVDPRRQDAVQRVGNVRGAQLSREAIAARSRDELLTIDQHPHQLDRVERHPAGAIEDVALRFSGDALGAGLEQRPHRIIGERLEPDRREGPQRGAPRRPAVQELGPRERDDQQLMLTCPAAEMLQEVQQPGIGPVQVLEYEDGRRLLGEVLEEAPPRAEELLSLEAGRIGRVEQDVEARLDPFAFVRIGDQRSQRRAQLPTC